jgi:hypothetical protein
MKRITALLFSWLFISSAIAENTAVEYKITKEWKVDANTTFELIARNQGFRIEVWDKEIIRIDFTLHSGDAKIEEEDFRDALKVNAEKSGNKLTVNTSICELSSSSIWNWIFSNKKTKEGYQVSNTIYIPRNIASLIFSLNYCDLKIGEINIPTKIVSNYGDVSVLKNKNRTIINASYSDITCGDMSHVKISASYSDFILNTIDTLTLNSSYGDIKLSNCQLLQSLSINYGNITIKKAGSVKATGTYSDININALSQEANTMLTYCDLKLNEIAKSISGISITSVYSDCTLKINPESPVNLQINDINGDISMNNSQLIITKKHETGNVTDMAAKTKSATDASPTIKINSKNSDIIFN